MKHILFITALMFGLSPFAGAQQLTPVMRQATIDTLLIRMQSHYVYPDIAKKMAEMIRKRAHAHAYDTVSNGSVFAKMLSDDLRSVSHDGHLGVDYSATIIPQDQSGPPSQQVIDDFRKQGADNNFAFRKLEMLEGNIGYLKLNTFWPADWIKKTAAGVMAFLSNADAIILDLRDNHGFAPDGVLLIESYFFADETHMTDQINNDEHTTRQYWTMSVVPGDKLATKKLYLLTSHGTFSAGEDFAYNMQAQKRAIVIGETTGGGAHGTRPYRLNEHFSASIPFSYSVNPVTHTDWEGSGVKPDINATSGQALLIAQTTAIKDLLQGNKDEPRRKHLNDLLAKREKELQMLSTGKADK